MRFLMLLAVSAALAQPQQNLLETGGSWNGRWWETTPPATKSVYVNGLRDGMALGVMTFSSVQDAQTFLKTYEPHGFVVADIIIELDKLYEDRANVRIPVIFGFDYVIQKLKGASEPDLENKLKRLRQSVAGL